MTRVAIIGSRGQLGSEIVAALQAPGDCTVIPLTREDIDVTDSAAVQHTLLAVTPEIVINCAAFVRVDESEDRPDEAFRVNAVGALSVARVCRDLDALCVYTSTDYVFDGQKGAPYTEEDSPRPINVYGASKLAGEYLVRQACSRWLIIRTASLFGKAGARGKAGNFVDTIVTKARHGEEIKVVSDIQMSPTYARDAAFVLAQLLRRNATGLIHLTNAGSCTWYELARTCVELLDVRSTVQAVPAQAYPTRAARPRNSSMTSVRLPRLGVNGTRPWQAALRAYLAERSLA